MMKERLIRARLSTGIVIIVAVGLLTGFRTDALRANWKYAGEFSPENEGKRTLAFYDAENVEYLADGGCEGLGKSVDASEIEEFVADEENIMKRAAEKTAASYYPPYFLLDTNPGAGADRCIEMIVWEEAANHADLKTRAKRLYEINCRERKIQSVSSITYRSDGTTTYASDFDRWSPITPGSTADGLHKILCK